VIRRRAKNAYEWRGIEKIVLSIETQIKTNVSVHNEVNECSEIGRKDS